RSLPVEKTGPFIDGVVAAKGTLVSVAREGKPHDGWTPYRLKAERGDWKLELATADGLITGLLIADWKSDPPIAKSTLAMRLPFKGDWFVGQGGPTKATNHHVEDPSQRRAADLVRVDASGQSHKGDGRANADYYAYGAEILAVADGTVVTAIDGVPENDPPHKNPYSGIGNAIVLAHDGGVWSAYAHLVPGSLRVRPGAHVKRGDVLGLCGNSGNSTEPHLHFQLQNGPRFEASWGVEAVFPDVRLVRDGKSENVVSYTFLRGDRIAQPE
ncbi:MAG TPA: M23 family metallopeptidase, partial [Labilithrix sp.]